MVGLGANVSVPASSIAQLTYDNILKYLWKNSLVKSFTCSCIIFAFAALSHSQTIDSPKQSSAGNYVHIDRVVLWPKGTGEHFEGKVRYVTASSPNRTYVLSCPISVENCLAPKVSESYKFIVDEDPRYKTKFVYLRSAAKRLGPFDLESFAPSAGPLVQKAIVDCESQDEFLDESSCVTWLNKKAKALTTECPDSNATEACRSFRELIAADDRDLMDDFATKTGYVCFRPKEDTFFEVWFSEPNGVWEKATEEDVKAGALPGSIIVWGGAGIASYPNGVWDEDKSMQTLGRWSYLSLNKQIDYSLANSGNSRFISKRENQQITIDDARFIATEKYKNQSGSETEHTITLQLANGRYVEKYDSQGRTLDSYSGRCIAVSPTAP